MLVNAAMTWTHYGKKVLEHLGFATTVRGLLKSLTTLKGLRLSITLPTWHKTGKKAMDESQQTLFSGFKKPSQNAKQGLQSSILGLNSENPMSAYPIQIKQGVVFQVLKPEIYSIFSIISTVFHEIGKECVITSANDGVHKGHDLYKAGEITPGKVSKHYLNLAIDLRTKHLLDGFQKQMIYSHLSQRLGSNYLVLFEYESKDNEHIHIGVKG